MKKWRCTVCGYIHEGPTPPDVCPVCGVGPEMFEEAVEDATDAVKNESVAPEKAAWQLAGNEDQADVFKPASFNFSYGLFIITSLKNGKINGQAANTAFQITDNPLRVAIGINKNNLTNEYIRSSGVFTVNILGQQGHDMVRNFGFRSGRDADKFADVKYITDKTGAPIINDCIAYLECRVIPEMTIDVGTHNLFIGEVVAGKQKGNLDPMTYAYYRKTK